MPDLKLDNLGGRCLWALLVWVLLSPVAAIGQVERPVLTGHARGQDGKPLVGAVVTIVATTDGVERQTATDSSGAYRLDGLHPGLYRLKANLAGFTSLERSVEVGRRSLSIDLVMTPVNQGASSHPPSNSTSAASRQTPTRRQRGFQTLTLQTPENLDASHDGALPPVSSSPSPGSDGSSALDSRSTDALLIQGSVGSDTANSPFGEGLSEDRIQEIRERIRESVA